MATPPKVELLLAGDARAVSGLCVATGSALRHLKPGRQANVTLIDCGFDAKDRAYLEERLSRFPNLSQLRLVPLDSLDFPDFQVGSTYIPLASYARFAVAELYPDTQQVIWLDYDTLTTCDLSCLYDFTLSEDQAYAAVRSSNFETIGDTPDDFDWVTLGVNPDARYHNSGVLLIHVAHWRKQHMLQRLMALEARLPGPSLFNDQTLLFLASKGEFVELNTHWNFQVMLQPEVTHYDPQYGAIIHFLGATKPWHFQRKGARGLVARYYRHSERLGISFDNQASLRQQSQPSRLMESYRLLRSGLYVRGLLPRQLLSRINNRYEPAHTHRVLAN